MNGLVNSIDGSLFIAFTVELQVDQDMSSSGRRRFSLPFFLLSFVCLESVRTSGSTLWNVNSPLHVDRMWALDNHDRLSMIKSRSLLSTASVVHVLLL